MKNITQIQLLKKSDLEIPKAKRSVKQKPLLADDIFILAEDQYECTLYEKQLEQQQLEEMKKFFKKYEQIPSYQNLIELQLLQQKLRIKDIDLEFSDVEHYSKNNEELIEYFKQKAHLEKITLYYKDLGLGFVK